MYRTGGKNLKNLLKTRLMGGLLLSLYLQSHNNTWTNIKDDTMAGKLV